LSRNAVSPEQQLQRIERAQRFKAVREAMQVTQPEFAERLTRAGKDLGLERVFYDVGDITTRENARKDLEIEDYILATRIDPEHRSIAWLAFGRDFPIKLLGMLPKPPKGPTTAPKDAGQGDEYPRRHRGK
jgi:hypothetical protein